MNKQINTIKALMAYHDIADIVEKMVMRNADIIIENGTDVAKSILHGKIPSESDFLMIYIARILQNKKTDEALERNNPFYRSRASN